MTGRAYALIILCDMRLRTCEYGMTTYNSFEHYFRISITTGINNTRTVNQMNSLHQGYVLPYLHAGSWKLPYSKRMTTFVSPAMGATLHTFLERNVLIIELLPVLGYPMNPTLQKCSSFIHMIILQRNKLA